ncbi:hypothetical protein [Spirilliplanes yamanashiensis]|uniref:Uncharacterized protein n=1 Tax=Spirilliplanes yamanashiensis TaxID=42233 RepID=A0A8J3YBH5_9ACTN|nr:hypothetical protein [Spirilliplanes yamanashiensis]MDP9818100.1 hypothetical protein [Spirilliplanes yamanashiensis]GIJ04910.1 hypothetical protein Sya03_42620 [Spirilliplanes yamanashiensis]
MTPRNPSSDVETPARVAALDPQGQALVRRLLAVAVRGLPLMYLPGADEFAFTRAGSERHLELRGTSYRYAAIVALGAHFLPEAEQRAVLGGHTADAFTDLLVRRLPETTNLGDAALVAWAAAQAGRPGLDEALRRAGELDDAQPRQYVVETSWLVSALATARGAADVEQRLARARGRLLGSRQGAGPLFPHGTDRGMLPWYRSHVGCFADQVYPIQALARLHASGDDPEALAAARACAERITSLQGAEGEFWWHYDARTGGLVEEFPVYSVHQHAMAPTALLDLAEVSGDDVLPSVRRGLSWLERPGAEPMIADELGMVWRKVYRGDPKKLARAINGVSTRLAPGVRPVRRPAHPTAVDRECRPYEFGWLLFAWLGAVRPGGAR